MPQRIEDRVTGAVDAWLRWLPKWRPGTHRARARICGKCLGSPLLSAAGITAEVPHQVSHALTSRLQRIIDKTVDEFTQQQLPALNAELQGAELWKAEGYDPADGLAPEYEGLDLDPEPSEPDQPFLFTLSGLAEESRAAPSLPRPPLSESEKQQLRAEITRADECAESAGQAVCFALLEHRQRIVTAIERFIEPQVQDLLADLGRSLEPPEDAS